MQLDGIGCVVFFSNFLKDYVEEDCRGVEIIVKKVDDIWMCEKKVRKGHKYYSSCANLLNTVTNS
jgi:hypothetical protein